MSVKKIGKITVEGFGGDEKDAEDLAKKIGEVMSTTGGENEGRRVLKTYSATKAIKDLSVKKDEDIKKMSRRMDEIMDEVKGMAGKAHAIHDEFWSVVQVELGLFGKKLHWNDETQEVEEYTEAEKE